MERPRDAVRRLKTDGKLNRPVTVMLRGGTYPMSRTLVLKPQDSGSERTPITYAALPGEEPILSGGRKITGWRGGQGQLWQVRLPPDSPALKVGFEPIDLSDVGPREGRCRR